MSRIQIKAGTRYVAQGDIHLIQKRLADRHYQIENLSTGETTIVSYDDLLQAWANGDLRFEITSPNARRDTEVPLNTRYQEDDLADLPDHIQSGTWRRYQLVLDLCAFAGLPTFQMLSRSEIEAFITAQGWQNRPTSVRSRIGEAISTGSVERYLQAFVDSGGDIRSLIPQTGQQGGRGKGRLHERVQQIITGVLDDFTHIWVWLLYILKRVERQRKTHDDNAVNNSSGRNHVFHPKYSGKDPGRSRGSD